MRAMKAEKERIAAEKRRVYEENRKIKKEKECEEKINRLIEERQKALHKAEQTREANEAHKAAAAQGLNQVTNMPLVSKKLNSTASQNSEKEVPSFVGPKPKMPLPAYRLF
jgi:regulator of protease activity HflC (stomatin/prohibitin superfamily)